MGGASQRVGETYLRGVTQLVEHQRKYQRQGTRLHLGVGGEEADEQMAAEDEKQARHDGQREQYVIARKGGLAHAAAVAEPGVVADYDGHGGSHRVVHAESESARDDYDLKRCQLHGSYPAHHHRGSRKRAALKGHLQRHRPRGVGDAPDDRPSERGGEESPGILLVFLPDEEYRDDDHCRHHTRHECGYAGTCQTQLGEAPVAVDEQIVAEYVEGVASEDNPHGHACAVDGVAPLRPHVEAYDREHPHQIDDEVWPDYRQQLLGLPQAVEIEIHHSHDAHQQQGEQEVDRDGVTYQLAHAAILLTGVEGAGERSDAHGHAETGEYGHVEEIVDKRCRRKRIGAVVAHHRGVGKPHDYHAQLPHEYGESERQYRLVSLQGKRHIGER